MDYIHLSVSEKIGSYEFVEKIKSNRKYEIVESLMELTNQMEIYSKLFFDYIFEMIKDHDLFHHVFINLSDKYNTSIVNLIKINGSNLFTNIVSVNERNARSAFNILKICLASDSSAANECLDILSQSPTFLILVASSRYFFHQEYFELSNKYFEIVPFQKEKPSFLFPITVLSYIMNPKIEIKPNYVFRNNLIPFVLMNLFNTNGRSIFASFIDSKTFFWIYSTVYNQHLICSTLETSYLLSNLLIRVWLEIINSGERLAEDVALSQELAMKFVEFLKEVNEGNDLETLYFGDESKTYEIPLDLRNIESLLLSTPNDTTTNNVDAARNYPRLSPSLPRDVIDLLPSYSGESELIEANADEFLFLLFRQDCFFSFVEQISQNLNKTNNDDFSKSWFLTLALIRKAWATGFTAIRTGISNFLNTMESGVVKSVLTQMIYPNIVQDYDSPKTLCPPLKVIAENHRRLSDIDSLTLVLKTANTKLFLWPSIIIYGLTFSNDRIKYFKFMEKVTPNVFPSTSVLFILFNQLAMKNPLTRKKYLSAFKQSDFQVLIENPPPSLDKVSDIILNHISSLNSSHIRHTEFINITVVWSALVFIFGEKQFSVFILELLKSKVTDSYEIHEAQALFKSAACCLVLTFSELNERTPDVLITSIIEDVENNSSSMQISCGMADLLLIVICNDNNWKQSFQKAIFTCVSLINKSCSQKSSLHFALAFIRDAIQTRNLLQFIDESVINALWKVHEYKTIIDYYMLKSSLP